MYDLLKKIKLLRRLVVHFKHQRMNFYFRRRASIVLNDLFDILKDDFIVFPIFGTLLGIMRENKLIKHDVDLDVGILIESSNCFLKLLKILYTNNFRIVSKKENVAGSIEPNILKLTNRKVRIDLYFFFNSNEDSAWCHKRVHGDISVSEFEKVTGFYGRDYIVPSNYLDLLIEWYGVDWETPDKYLNQYRSKK